MTTTCDTSGIAALESTVAKPITVTPEISQLPSKIGTPEFETALTKEFTGKHPWRSSAGLAKKLGVDAKELEVFLDKNKNFTRRPNDKDDGFLYAVVKRVAEDDGKNKSSTKQTTVRPEDRFALAVIHMIRSNMDMLLNKYGRRIYEENEEVMSHLTNSFKHLQSAEALFASSTKINLNQLP